MMKYLPILLCALVMAQGHKQKQDLPSILSENADEDLLGPFVKDYFYLQHLIQEINQYQQTQQLSSLAFLATVNVLPSNHVSNQAPFTNSLESEACNDLTKSMVKAVSFAENVGYWAIEAGHEIWNKFMSVFHCGNINPVTAFKCVVSGIKELKGFIKEYKSDIVEIKEEINELAKELKMEFNECRESQKQQTVPTTPMQ